MRVTKVVGDYRGESRAVGCDDGGTALVGGGEECRGWQVIRCLQRIEHEHEREQQGGNEGGVGSRGVGDLGRALDCRGAHRLDCGKGKQCRCAFGGRVMGWVGKEVAKSRLFLLSTCLKVRSHRNWHVTFVGRKGGPWIVPVKAGGGYELAQRLVPPCLMNCALFGSSFGSRLHNRGYQP